MSDKYKSDDSGSGGKKSAFSRRELFSFGAYGLTGAALSSLVSASEGEGARATHFAPKAKRVIHICLMGGMSHIDSFDYKPGLGKLHGKELQYEERPATFFNQIGLIRKNDWSFKQHGESGMWVSDLFPHLATVADELTVINSMVADSANHTPATFQQNTGFQLNGFPVMGSWISYGLGSETEDLPAYVVLPDARGYPAGGTINWSNGFLPSMYQGVAFNSQGTPIPDLFPPEKVTTGTDMASRKLLAEMNQDDLARYGSEDALLARIRSHELAARMQLAVPEVTGLDSETESTLEMYGLNRTNTADFGKNCLLSRRLLEKGVRFVQIISGGSFGSPRINWDGHEDMVRNHNREAERIDQPVAALIKDLKQRSMLEDTLLLFTTEFGRTPYTQAGGGTLGTGRDHNMYGFSVFMAGAGLKTGMNYGETDELGWKSVLNQVHWHDFHATVLHLLGMDHEQLTFYHNGIERRLTNVHGNVVKEVLA
jgi:hypothetical protein